jgi:hypothetical protein
MYGPKARQVLSKKGGYYDAFTLGYRCGSFCIVAVGFDHIPFFWRRDPFAAGYCGYSDRCLVYFRTHVERKEEAEMIFRPDTFLEKLKRLFNPDMWMVKLLRLSMTKEQAVKPGVVVIQVDGLSHAEFTHALNKGEMPHLAGLLKKEGYAGCAHYSGQPSCTPAVQGELFYGVKSCVPAFSFRDKKTGKVFNMFSPSNASEIEKRARGKARRF